jgi:hypothetical protein
VLPSSNSFVLQLFTIARAILPLLLLTSIERINFVNVLSFESIMRDNLFLSSFFSSITPKLVGISTFPKSTSLIPERLALARNFSLQLGHSSFLPEKLRTPKVLNSVITRQITKAHFQINSQPDILTTIIQKKKYYSINLTLKRIKIPLHT